MTLASRWLVFVLAITVVGWQAAADGLEDDLVDSQVKTSSCFAQVNRTLFGWKDDVKAFIAKKRTIVIEQNAWDSSRIAVATLYPILTELLGYRVLIKEYFGGKTSGPRLDSGLIDIAVELWPSDSSWYNDMVRTRRTVLDSGSLGYTGRVGLYVPTYMFDLVPNVDFDFWKFFKNPKALAAFPRPGTAPHVLTSDGLPLCTADELSCINNTYVPARYRPELAQYFVEIVHVTPDYSYAVYPRLIDGLGLNATIKYIGDSFEPYIKDLIQSKSPFIAYYWKPTALISANNLTRITFPDDSYGLFSKFLNDRSTPIKFDIPSDAVFKALSPSFSDDFPELVGLMQKFQLGESDMDILLRNLATSSLNSSEVACNWLNEDSELWSKWIPPPPKLYVTCEIGQGKYEVNGLALCLTCPAGTFNWVNNTADPCQPCPDHAICPGGDRVNVASGYWLTEKTADPKPSIYKCPNFHACCPDGNCTASEQCSDGFSGILCSTCEKEGYALWHDKCMECSTPKSSLYIILFFPILVCIMVLFIPPGEIPTLEFLFFFYQVTDLIFNHNVEQLLGSTGIKTFLAVLSLDIDGMVLNCPAKLFGVPKLLFRFLFPCLLLIYLAALYGIATVFCKKVTSTDWKRFLPSYMREVPMHIVFFHGFETIFTLTNMPLVEAALELLDCRVILDQSLLYTAPQTKCFSRDHTAGLIVGIATLVLLLLVLPGALFILLLNAQRKGILLAEGNKEKANFGLQILDTMADAYQSQFFYFEAVQIVEKGLIVVFFKFFTGSDSKSIIAYILLFMILSLIRIYVQPYSSRMKGFLMREIYLLWFALLGFRLAISFVDKEAIVPYIVFILIIPATFHVIRRVFEELTKSSHHQSLSKLGLGIFSTSNADIKSDRDMHASRAMNKSDKSNPKLKDDGPTAQDRLLRSSSFAKQM
ncbi:hypothetical protein HDU97_002887 [Phlyctochytrium planicorne]|nr:hypothetical protein HDU97_002887 [Phlyctochytrium planicorne]